MNTHSRRTDSRTTDSSRTVSRSACDSAGSIRCGGHTTTNLGWLAICVMLAFAAGWMVRGKAVPQETSHASSVDDDARVPPYTDREAVSGRDELTLVLRRLAPFTQAREGDPLEGIRIELLDHVERLLPESDARAFHLAEIDQRPVVDALDNFENEYINFISNGDFNTVPVSIHESLTMVKSELHTLQAIAALCNLRAGEVIRGPMILIQAMEDRIDDAIAFQARTERARVVEGINNVARDASAPTVPPIAVPLPALNPQD